jgi:hypothetical protein
MSRITKHIKSNIIIPTIMILLFSFQLSKAQNSILLDTIITYKSKEIKLSDALNDLGAKLGFNFSYNSDLIASKRLIKAKYVDKSLNIILSDLIKDSTLTFKVVDKQIVISKKNQLSSLSFIRNDNNYVQYIRIKGKVFDQETGKPLSFSNVSVKGKSIGSISNELGVFNLNISKGFIMDSLVFSYIGYNNAVIPINQLAINDNIIYLVKDQFNIKEVVIRSYNAKEILKQAILDIDKNYYTDPYQITAFYREMVKKEKDLAAISEAVLNVYKSPYLGPYSDQIKLLKGRKDEFYSKNDTVALKLKAGLFTSLYLDVIKNQTYFLQEKYFCLYSYYVEKVTSYNNRSVYEIVFKPAIYLDENSFEGKIYIDTDDLTMIALDFNITPDALDRMGRGLIVKKAFRTKVKTVLAHYTVNYRKINGKYYLSFAKGELRFKVKRKKSFFSTDFRTSFEFATNNVDTINIERFDRNDIISTHKVFLDENYEYDHQFWGEYNYICPEKTLQDALVEIQQKVDKLNQE